MTDYKTFDEMSKEEQLALFVAWQEGKRVFWTYSLKKEWIEGECVGAIFYEHLYYRTAAPKPFFDFSPFNEKWKWAVRDEGGDIFIYKEKPTKNVSEGIWEAGKNNDLYFVNEIVKKSLTNLFDLSIPWQESLVSRDGVE